MSNNKTSLLSKVIDFSTNVYSPALYARKVWKVLFDIGVEKEGPSFYQDMDNLLIDYTELTRMFEKNKPFELYWDYGKNGGVTILNQCYYNADSYTAKISYDIVNSTCTITQLN